MAHCTEPGIYLYCSEQPESLPLVSILSQINPIHALSVYLFNLLAPELFFFNLEHPVYKMWIIQEPNTLELWNKLHFEEEETESIYRV